MKIINVRGVKMGKVIINNNNELIIKRRKKRLLKKNFSLLIIFSIVIIVLCYKLPFFNIRSIEVNNKLSNRDEIIKLAGIYLGNNIFYTNTKEAQKNVITNPYISQVQIKRILPSKIKINVNERIAFFYLKEENFIYLIDKNGFVLDKKENIDVRNLIEVKNNDIKDIKIGTKLPSKDDRLYNILNEFSNIIAENKDLKGISYIELTNFMDIKIFYNNFLIKLGNYQDITQKINKALTILQIEDLKNKKGYIDVSYKGNPVFFIDKAQ